ncbi:MAG: valine--tRNA ligase [Alphaproteobacteria bacterium]|nr:MAG: valine--tRNA ligase [Alphaproteobacteria bacterium]
MLESRYNHKEYEDKIYKKSKPKQNPGGEKFCIIMPPPNVTGSLHLGHALTYTLQDILCRYKRQKGFDVLWQPGTDHAGIATQIIVESKLDGTKEDIGKEKFLEKTWDWVNHSQTSIQNQQEKLGILPNWERKKFTLDPDVSKIVTDVFVRLYKDGLLYRDKRLVNFDFKLKTALSDLEVVNKDVQDKMYYIRYPVADASGEHIVVATTRPETIFADVALAVHPDAKQHQGKTVFIPLADRKIPVIADEHADPEKGSGVVKITPAHDFNDFEVGKRHDLAMIDIIDDEGRLTVPLLNGQKPLDARKEVETLLQELDLLEKVEVITHTVPFSERTGERIEPRLTTQWFCNMESMAKQALEQPPNFIPDHWISTYGNFLQNIEPWCVSRQLWWGHTIPAYYGPNGEIFVEKSLEEAQKKAGASVTLTQDPDVLDTWFSSALWPFSTQGWPDNLTDYFPTSVLITGFDIIFFWVARMVMMSYYCTKQLPFKDVYIHALVRDAKGNKMSKSKGNVIDPLDLIDKYGADALRLSLTALSIPGRNINIGEKIVEGYSHFITKLWNAGRFLSASKNQAVGKVTQPLNLWILDKLHTFIQDVETHLDAYRFDLVVKSFYEFFWNTFCDIYLEGVKTLDDNENVPIYVYKILLKVMHPVIPLVTTKLLEEFGETDIDTWPKNTLQGQASDEIDLMVKIIEQVRSIKGLLGLKSGLTYSIPSTLTVDKQMLKHFLKAGEIVTDVKAGVPVVVETQVIYIMVDDMEQVMQILQAHQAKIKNDMTKTKALLDNEKFKLSKPDAWEEKKETYEKFTAELKTVESMMR